MSISHNEFGPEYVLEVYDAKIGMRGFLVIDNTALGPGKGGIRMTPDVTVEEVFRLARTMTWKNALAGIPFGGAKAGIVWDPSFAKKTGKEVLELKKEFMQSFARALKPLVPKKYIAGPDVNTGEKDMQHFVEAAGNWRAATGKPANYCMKVFGKEGEKCGIPHEFGSTGFGVAQATKVATELSGINIKGARVAIEGFGNVGTFAFSYLKAMGAKIVAVASRDSTVYLEDGLQEKILAELREQKRSLREYPHGTAMDHDAIFGVDADILIPAAVTDVIHDGNKNTIKAKIIVEGANIPMSEKVERELFSKGILIVPDFIANAGGVISSYAEYRGYNPKRMFELVERRIVATVTSVLKKSMKQGRSAREVAMELAQEKVSKRMKAKKTTFV